MDSWENKLGEVVEVEESFLYPLLKSSDVFHNRTQSVTKQVVITQRNLGEKTDYLQSKAPLLWNYLNKHHAIFECRKSSIYRDKPPFSIFGIGEYSFAPYKVAISGMYKKPRFQLIAPMKNCPVMLDDTCYFLPCSSAPQAAILVALLRHSFCQDFIDTIIFSDAKRPITKKLLQRLDLRRLLDAVSTVEIIQSAQGILSGHELSASDIDWQYEITNVFTEYDQQPKLFY